MQKIPLKIHCVYQYFFLLLFHPLICFSLAMAFIGCAKTFIVWQVVCIVAAYKGGMAKKF
jgi:hypothetical protein